VPWLFYVKLIGYTAGTLVYLFLIVMIVGNRRPRLFERLLFFVALALFLIYSGGLLEINAQIQYGSISPITQLLYLAISGMGMIFLPALLVQSHLQYFYMARRRTMQGTAPRIARLCVGLFYILPFVDVWMRGLIDHRRPLPNFLLMLTSLGVAGSDVLIFAIIACAWTDWRVWRSSTDPVERKFFEILCGVSVLITVPLALHRGIGTVSRFHGMTTETAIVALCIVPGTAFIYFALRRNFLEYGAQRNLVYALSGSFLAVLYLAFVRRVSGWLEPALPPEATAAILLFVLIFLFEPLERVIGPVLHRKFRERISQWQRLAAELQDEARQGEVARFVGFTESRIREEFGLAAARLRIPADPNEKPLEAAGGLGHAVQVPLRKDGKVIGELEAASTGAFLTGETSAALEFLAGQLPAMLDLCRLIEEKIRLERELAERERLALLGQMAASVSHNLRNPLSSMKTILQVQLEHPYLPIDVRRDCALVVGEIDRMGEKLKQLLNFAKPSVNGRSVAAVALARQTAALFTRDAERRNLRLEFDGPTEEISVLASEDALGEVLSNLIVNAIEAQPAGGRVRVRLSREGERLEIRVEDDGPGISKELRAKIFQPYFTTKATGTGLGLSIVARRTDEMGGTISCESPVRDGKGTRFILTLPLEDQQGTKSGI
jgi:signal transduction histidine kinase